MQKPVRYIEFYKDFACRGGGCPETCCRGWHIYVDEKTYARYQKAKGLKGVRLKLSTFKMDGKYPMMRKLFYRCTFHTKERLCAFQKNGTPELMPKVCRYYPRRITEHGDLWEVTLELSCVEAAKRFLECDRRKLEFETGTGQNDVSEVTWDLLNDDASYRAFLRADREKLLDYLWEKNEGGTYKKTLPQAFDGIYRYAWALQQALFEGDPNLTRAKHLQSLPIPDVDEADIKNPFYPVTMLNDLIYTYLDEPDLFMREPHLYRLIFHYKKTFGKQLEKDADRFFRETLRRMEESDNRFLDKYRAYFSYCLQELYMDAYEDYYVIGEVFLALIFTEFLMLFDASEFLTHHELSTEKQARILAVLEAGIRHSIRTKKEFLQKIRSDWL